MTVKKVKLRLVGLDGNAFVILGAFRRAAQREGWTPEEYDEVFREATKGDYNHLLSVISDHCEGGGL